MISYTMRNVFIAFVKRYTFTKKHRSTQFNQHNVAFSKKTKMFASSCHQSPQGVAASAPSAHPVANPFRANCINDTTATIDNWFLVCKSVCLLILPLTANHIVSLASSTRGAPMLDPVFWKQMLQIFKSLPTPACPSSMHLAFCISPSGGRMLSLFVFPNFAIPNQCVIGRDVCVCVCPCAASCCSVHLAQRAYINWLFHLRQHHCTPDLLPETVFMLIADFR